MTTYRLDKSVRLADDGHVVIGGSPLRILTLAPKGADALRAIEAGESPAADASVSTLVRRLLLAGIVHPVPPTDAPLPSFAMVIPTRNRAVDHLVSLFPEAKEVVVVDDASAEPVMPWGAEVIRMPTAGGPAAARNAGWRSVHSDVVVFLDSDCLPRGGWLRMLQHLSDPAVVAVAPRVVATPAAGLLARYEAAGSPLDLGPEPAAVIAGSRVSYVPSAALAVRRSALEAAGGFDESLRYGEDVDLVWRLTAAGGVVRYEPSSIVEHPARDTFAGWLRQRFDYGTSAAPLSKRHPEALAPLRVSAWSALAWALVAAGRGGLGLGVAAVTTVLLPRKLTMLRNPWPEALRLAGVGHLFSARQIGDAMVRAWWPVALLAALLSRRARRVALAATLFAPLVEWLDRRPRLDPLRWTVMRLLDGAAYGAGVWVGCFRERTIDPLVPRNPSFLPLRSGDAVAEDDRRREEQAADGDRADHHTHQ